MNPRLTRSELLRRGAAGGALLAFPSLLAACGGGGGGGSQAGGEVKDVLNFSNWELYIDTPSRRKKAGMSANPTTLEQFTTKSGIKVNYYEDINGNPEYFATVQGRLAQGQGIGRDIIVSTDNDKYLGEYLDNDWALKLDKSLIPNISNLIDVQAHPPFDSNRDYTLPWFSGMDGIAWNEDVTGPVTTVKQLFEDPKLKGKVGVWGQMGDTLGLIMLSPRSSRRSTRARSASSTATITRRTSRPATSRPRSRGRATSSTSRTRSSIG
jgi:spermidine/putrescine transport system substrate-binding protein